MGKHKAEDENPKKPASLSDLLAGLRELGDQLGVDLPVKVMEGGSRVHVSTKFPDAEATRWGGEEKLKAVNGEVVPHMAEVLSDAGEAETPVEVLLNNGKVLYGRVISVSSEIFCLEVWKHRPHEDEEECALTRPDNPQQAYIDIAAVDALIDIPGFFKGCDDPACCSAKGAH